MDISINSYKKSNFDQTEWPPIDTSNIDEEYLCPQCKNVLRNVHQTYDCGCRFCYQCLENIINSGMPSCPACDTPINSNTKVADKFFQKKINRIQVSCQFEVDKSDKPCGWQGDLSAYQEHYAEHLTPKLRVCEYCQAEFYKRELLDEHLNELTGACKEQPVVCPYAALNCYASAMSNESKNRMTDLENLDITPTISEEHVLKRKDLNNHLAINQAYHLDLVYKNLGNRLEKLESTCEDYDRSSVVSLEHLKPNMNSQVSTDDYGYSGTGSVNSHMSQNIDILANHSEFDANSFYDSRIEPKFAETNLKLDLLEMNQKNLVNDITKLVQANEGLKQENYRFKESVKEYKTICADLHRALALTQVSLMSLEQRLLNQENTSHDGVLLWKITNVIEKIQESKSGHQASFYSPPFYTDRNGYKMCARIYLNGDGQGLNTHVSLFFVLLRGDYDSLLTWPFNKKCTFILIDQNNANNNIADAFRPDPNSSSFRRPKLEMNVASGLPIFCPLTVLNAHNRGYIKENTMFIKIIVGSKDLNLS